jgi:hypothetical protein
MSAGNDRWRDSSVPLASVMTALFVGAMLMVTRALFGEDVVLATVFYFLTITSLVIAYDGGRADPTDAILRLTFALGLVISVCLVPIGLGPRVLLLLVGVASVLLVAHRGGMRLSSLGAAMAASATLAATLFLTVNGKYYANVFVADSLLVGLAHTDTLYHSAIAGMFASFGVPSTGLDGIPLSRYHTLSNMLLGLLAKGAEVAVPTGYFLGMQVLLLPLLYFCLGAATSGATVARGTGAGVASFVVPAALVAAFGLVDLNAYQVSESHALGLALLLLGCIALRRVSRGQPLAWATLIATCIIALLATATKVSIGAVFLCGLGVAFLLSRSLRPVQWAAFAAFLAALAALSLTLFLPVEHGARSRIVPFAFVIEFPVVALVNLAVIGVGLFIGIAQIKGAPSAIWPKAFLVMLLASTAPAMLLQVDGGSAYYFLNIGTWLTMVEVAALAIDRFRSRRLFFSATVILLAGCGLVTALVQQTPARVRGLIEAYYARTPRPDDVSALPPLWEQLQSYKTYRPKLNMSVLATAIEKAKVDNRSLVLLTDNVWRDLPFSCTDAPFAIPAYLSLPMLMGMRTVSRDCSFGPHYSYPDYDHSPPAAQSLTETEICLAARARGFEHVLLARSLGEVDEITCPPG